jgi:tripartite-type tricarboxylate transporter receptor subunit TctC
MSSSKGTPRLTPSRRIFVTGAFSTAAVIGQGYGGWSGLRGQPLSYPDRPIQVVFPYAAGGGPETTLRFIVKRVEEDTGAVVVIEDRPGAGGSIGATFVKRSPPDGYTLLQGDFGCLGTDPWLFKNLPYDPIADFEPITLLYDSKPFLLVPASLKVNSVKELYELAKTKPGGLTYGSAGVGSGGHICGAMLAKAFGTPMTHIPYRGSEAIRTDILAGRVDMVFNSLEPYLGDIQAGTVKALGVASDHRAPNAPSTPTMAELGYPSVVLDNWFGLFAPSGTDAAILDKLNAIFSQAANAPAVVSAASAIGFFVHTTSRAEFSSFVKQQVQFLGRIVRENNMHIQ